MEEVTIPRIGLTKRCSRPREIAASWIVAQRRLSFFSLDAVMLCDVCNAQTNKADAIYVAPSRFRELMNQGFGIDETNIRMLTDAGMSRDAAVAALKAQYATSQSFWVLCSDCARRAEALL